nr:MAG TPA: hypothetical protein [Caudoviricetes sp.]
MSLRVSGSSPDGCSSPVCRPSGDFLLYRRRVLSFFSQIGVWYG